MPDQRPYWNRAATDKDFTHPLNEAWLAALSPDCRVLDYGCGYGRTLDHLARLGFRRSVGYDFAPAMVARGRREHPDLDLRTLDRPALPDPDASYDAAFLVAVLTCIPDDPGQDAVLAELRRVLRPGGTLYVSDMPLQGDARNLRRYADAQPGLGRYGVFRTEDGATVRHHSDDRFASLLAGFDVVAAGDVPITTMNGTVATARQFLARRRGPAGPA